MDEHLQNRFERHPRLIMAVIWIVMLFAAVAGLECLLSPGSERHVGTASASSPAPRRYLVMREWGRNTDYRMAAPKTRYRDKTENVRDVYMLSTDDNGFIEPAIRHRDADLNIVFLGGSTTESMFVNPENRFPFLAAKKLEESLGLKINGINASRSGNATMHSLLLFLGKVAPLKPDYAVLMHATNDISILANHGSYWTNDKDSRLVLEKGGTINDGIRTILNQIVPYSSRTLQRAKRTIELQVRGLFSDAKAADDDLVKGRNKAAWRHHGEMFESALRSFVSAARSWKVEPVLMTQVLVKERPKSTIEGDYITPDKLARAGLDVESFGHIHDYFNAIIRHVAETEEVLLIDLASAREWWRGRDVYDSIHFTDAGSEEVAGLISEALKERIARTRQP
jgi:hypothetical protein